MASPLSKKVADGTKTKKVKTSHLLRIDEHDFTMRPAFAGKTWDPGDTCSWGGGGGGRTPQQVVSHCKYTVAQSGAEVVPWLSCSSASEQPVLGPSKGQPNASHLECRDNGTAAGIWGGN